MNISPTIDHSLMLLLNGDLGSVMDSFMWTASSKLATVPLVLYFLYRMYKIYGWRRIVVSIVIIALMITFADQISNLFKQNLSRLRPSREPLLEGLLHHVNGYRGGMYGTVSAHAANSIAVLGFCSSIIKKRWFTMLSILFCLTICYSRIYLGVHYPLDILWGSILGALTAFGGIRLYIFVVNRKIGCSKN